MREFLDDGCTDLAAALTYYSVLAIFPAAIALMSLLGLIGQSRDAANAVLNVLEPLVANETLDNIEGTLSELAGSQAAGAAFVIGIALALCSASSYIGAFGRAMNTIYEVEEGRPIWKLRPLQLLITAVTVVLSALVLLMLIVSGPVADSIGKQPRGGRHRPAGLEHREVAGADPVRGDDRRPALLRNAQRAAARASAGSRWAPSWRS